MTLQTGGTAFGEISTKSKLCASASSIALENGYTPISIFSPTNLTSSTPRIN